MNSLQNYLLLSEINLNGQKIIQPISANFQILQSIHSFNFDDCIFSINSLSIFFKILSSYNCRFALSLSKIKFSDFDLNKFYSNLKMLPPLNFISELNWSDNSIPSEHILNFSNYFFSGNQLKFLKIDRIFNSKNSEDLYKFLLQLSKKMIYGISIGGSLEHNFGDNFFLI